MAPPTVKGSGALTSPTTPIAPPTSTNYSALAMVTTLFFMWGFITVLNDVLVPHLKSIFDLNYAEVMLIQFAFFTAYFVFSLPSGKLVEWLGYKRVMVTGLCTMAAGSLLFIAAASIPSFPVFLTALIIVAAGMTQLQVSANPYVAVLGPAETASSRLNLAQAFNSLGTFIGPLFGSALILTATEKTQEQIRALAPADLHAYRIQEAASVKMPYLGIGLTLLALALVIAFFKLPKIASVEAKIPAELSHLSIWRFRHLVLGAIGIFVYVGAEVSIGSFLVNYLNQNDIAGLPLDKAARYLSYYWGGAMVGRFIGSALLQKIKAGTLLGIFAVIACLLVVTTMLSFGSVAMWSVLAIGLFNSIMFPTIFTLGIEGLGPFTGKGSGLLIAAIIGGAIVPEVQGILADKIGNHHAFFLPAICYLYIAWFGWISRAPAALPDDMAIPAEPVP
jgi:FHS family L-fucose permease-like MFS transporter